MISLESLGLILVGAMISLSVQYFVLKIQFKQRTDNQNKQLMIDLYNNSVEIGEKIAIIIYSDYTKNWNQFRHLEDIEKELERITCKIAPISKNIKRHHTDFFFKSESTIIDFQDEYEETKDAENSASMYLPAFKLKVEERRIKLMELINREIKKSKQPKRK